CPPSPLFPYTTLFRSRYQVVVSHLLLFFETRFVRAGFATLAAGTVLPRRIRFPFRLLARQPGQMCAQAPGDLQTWLARRHTSSRSEERRVGKARRTRG